MNTTGHSLIVVGVAATHGSQAALTFVMREASLRGSTLEVITAWEWDIDSDTLTLKQPFDVAGDAELAQEAAIARALASATPPPRITRRVLQGDARLELSRRARNADMLVVGKTQKNLVKRVLLGSVSQYCVRYAPCPVVVVPEGGAVEETVDRPLATCPLLTTGKGQTT